MFMKSFKWLSWKSGGKNRSRGLRGGGGGGRSSSPRRQRNHICGVESLEGRQMLAVGVAVIGDSLSADYSYEIPANELLPTSAKSWVQLLAQNRATNVNFGSLGAAG